MKSININKIKDMKDITILDVREAYEYEQNCIEGSINIPLSTLESDYTSLDKDKTYYVMCLGGGRSANACMFLLSKGYDVVNLDGGLAGYFK